MLARTAEYLFWTGRYLERAENTARLFDVTYHRLLEVTPAEEAEAWSDVLDRRRPRGRLRSDRAASSAAPVSEFLVRDPRTQARSWPRSRQARDNAAGVREHLPMELWEASTRCTSTGRPGPRRRPGHAALRALRLRPHRDPGRRRVRHRDLVPRRRLAVLHAGPAARAGRDVRADPAGPSPPPPARRRARVVRDAAGPPRRCRPTGASTGPSTVAALVELLLLSPTLPRSVLFSLRARRGRSSVALGDRPTSRSVGLRLLGRVRAELEFADAARVERRRP